MHLIRCQWPIWVCFECCQVHKNGSYGQTYRDVGRLGRLIAFHRTGLNIVAQHVCLSLYAPSIFRSPGTVDCSVWIKISYQRLYMHAFISANLSNHYCIYIISIYIHIHTPLHMYTSVYICNYVKVHTYNNYISLMYVDLEMYYLK